MKRVLLLVLSLCSMSAFAQWDFGGFGGGGWDFGGGNNGGGYNFGGEGSGNSGNINDYQSKKNIDYVGDNHVGHKLDIYFPKDDGKATHNVIVHIYGSAWMVNDGKGSADLGTVGTAALGAGYILVCPNHRSLSDAQYPAQINDMKAVVRYLRGNAQELGIDTSFIAFSGFSSGGHLASLMGVTRNVERTYTVGSTTMDIEGDLGRYTNESSWIDAVCDWSGPVDCRKKYCGNAINMSPENDMVGGCSDQQCPDKHALLAANTYIDETDAPTIVVHGASDNTVPQCEGEDFYNNLKKAGVECEYHPHSGGHGVEGSLTGTMIEFFNKAREKKAASQPQTPSDPTLVNELKEINQSICVDNDRLYICDENAETTQFSLTDVSGKVIMNGTLNSEGVNISSLNKGVYFVRTSNGGSINFIK